MSYCNKRETFFIYKISQLVDFRKLQSETSTKLILQQKNQSPTC